MTRVLTLDVGTSSARALVVDEAGRPLPGVEGKVRYTRTRGHSGRLGAFDAEELVATVRSVLDEARREAGGGVDAVAASCFWHSVLAVDAEGRALTPVLTWRDVRAAAEAQELRSRLDERAVHRRTGCHLHPSYWPAKLLRLRRTDPDAWARAARFLSFADFVQERLTGDARTSLSMASGTGLLDTAGRWDEELLAALELDAARLPVADDAPFEHAGERWFPALGDGACANVGVGAVGPRRAALSLGTSGALRRVRPAGAEPREGLFLYRLDAERAVEGGALSDGGNLHDWLERTLRLDDGDDVVDDGPDGHGLTFLALLGGERSPGWHPSVGGAVLGLTFETTPAQLRRAALEGVALRFAEIADLMPEAEEVVATGGAVEANPDWVQILADVLERPVLLAGATETSALGAAAVALERLGHPVEPPPARAVVEPRPERFDAYRRARERQRRLYAAAVEHRP